MKGMTVGKETAVVPLGQLVIGHRLPGGVEPGSPGSRRSHWARSNSRGKGSGQHSHRQGMGALAGKEDPVGH